MFNRYDHVFDNFAGYGEGPTLKLVNSIKAIPFSVVFHFPRSLAPQRYFEFERWGFPARAQHLIGVSDFVGQQAEDWAHRPVSVIGHGVDMKRFRPDPSRRKALRQSLGFSDDASVLVTAAALEERKGIQWIVRALPEILTVFPETFYIVLGEGSYRAELETLIRELDLANTFSCEARFMMSRLISLQPTLGRCCRGKRRWEFRFWNMPPRGFR